MQLNHLINYFISPNKCFIFFLIEYFKIKQFNFITLNCIDLEDGETVLKIKEGTVKNIAVNVHQDPQWVIEYYAYPMPDFEWHDPHYNKIINSTKFIVVQTPQKIKLKILNADLNDTGTYHLELNNGVKEEFQLNLTVSSKFIFIFLFNFKYRIFIVFRNFIGVILLLLSIK